MSDLTFRIAIRTYRNMKKVLIAFLRFLTRDVMLFRLNGIPVHLEYSFFLIAILPVAMILFAPTGTMLSLLPMLPAFLVAAFLSVLVHELGHAFFVRRCRMHVEQIYIAAFHGVCRYSHSSDTVPPVSIAWGGVLAQALLSALLIVYQQLAPPIVYGTPDYVLFFNFFVGLMLIYNLFMVAINLVPFPGLDGEIIWNHLKHWWRNKFG